MLVLASASPRRRELLTQAGFTFHVHPAHIPEDPRPNEDPIAYVIRLAREKAEAVFAALTQNPVQSAGENDKRQGTTSVVPQKPQNEARALQAAEKPLIPVSSSLFEGVFGLLGVNSIVVFVSVGRFFGLQTHFGPIGPAIQSESASSCALGFAP